MTKCKEPAVPLAQIVQSIVWLRGHKVLLDTDLASLYGVKTKVLVAVKRNLERLPDDFMFQLSAEELGSLRSQCVISNTGAAGGATRPMPLPNRGWQCSPPCSTARKPSRSTSKSCALAGDCWLQTMNR